MLNEPGRASGDGSILDARLLRLMRAQKRKVEQVVADGSNASAHKIKAPGKKPRPIDRTARFSAAAG